jgi:hypothetical protein
VEVTDNKEAELQAQLTALLQHESFDAMLGEAVSLGKQAVVDLLHYRERQRKDRGSIDVDRGGRRSSGGSSVGELTFASLSSLATQLVDSLLTEQRQLQQRTAHHHQPGREDTGHKNVQNARTVNAQRGFHVRDVGGLWFEQEIMQGLAKKAAVAAGNGAIVAQDVVFGSIVRAVKLFWQPLRMRRFALFETVLSRGLYGAMKALGGLGAGLLLRLGSWVGGELLPAGQVLAYTSAYAILLRKGLRGWLTALGVVKVLSSLVLPPPTVVPPSVTTQEVDVLESLQ